MYAQSGAQGGQGMGAVISPSQFHVVSASLSSAGGKLLAVLPYGILPMGDSSP